MALRRAAHGFVVGAAVEHQGRAACVQPGQRRDWIPRGFVRIRYPGDEQDTIVQRRALTLLATKWSSWERWAKA